MDVQLFERIPVHDVPGLLELVENLGREVHSLRQEVFDLRRENAHCGVRISNCVNRRAIGKRSMPGPWNASPSWKQSPKQLRGENRQLQARLFGQKSEHTSSPDRFNQLEGENQAPSSEPRKRGQRADRPGPGRRDSSRLPVQEEFHELSPDQRTCSQCGGVFTPSNTEDCDQIEIEVRAYRRRIRRRR